MMRDRESCELASSGTLGSFHLDLDRPRHGRIQVCWAQHHGELKSHAPTVGIRHDGGPAGYPRLWMTGGGLNHFALVCR